MVKSIMEFIVSILIMVRLFLLMSFIYSVFVMLIWDISVPYIFGLPQVTWLQAWCLVMLANIFFKGTAGVKK